MDWSSDVCSSVLAPAIFAGENLLNLLRSQRGEDPLEIAAEPGRDIQRLSVAPRAVDVEQAGEQFMDRVERRPRPVEIEAARANIARLDFVEDFHAVDDRAVLALA